ncbi:MAG TPA: Uma2 family endonuclease [Nostocaceae cyanobacterium]|nr:Uma2 family endonuclease [Nostocaceae cyanobacterium]
MYIPQCDPPLPPWETLPTMYDLPSENPEEPGLPDEFHFLQPLLLYLTFQPIGINPELVFSAADMNLYYDIQHTLWYKRPDWFGVVGVPRLYQGRDLRLSYVCWQEVVNPFVVIELLSPGTENEDLGQKESKANQPPNKWEVYERILRVPYYIVFSRYTNELRAFHLSGGHYEPMNLIEGRLPMPEIGLSLGLWEGCFRNIERLWLRWFTLNGELIPEPSEEADTAKERAIIAEQEAEAAKRKAELLAARLRELGVNPDELG